MNKFIFDVIQQNVAESNTLLHDVIDINKINNILQSNHDTQSHVILCFISSCENSGFIENLIKHIEHNYIRLKLIFIDTRFNHLNFVQTHNILNRYPKFLHLRLSEEYIYEYIIATTFHKHKLLNDTKTSVTSNVQMKVIDITQFMSVSPTSSRQITLMDIEQMLCDIFDSEENYPILKWNSLEINGCVFNFVEYLANKFHIPLITKQSANKFGVTNINDLIEYEMFNSYIHCANIEKSLNEYNNSFNLITLDKLHSFDQQFIELTKTLKPRKPTRTRKRIKLTQSVHIHRLRLHTLQKHTHEHTRETIYKPKTQTRHVRRVRPVRYVSKRLQYLKRKREQHEHLAINKPIGEQVVKLTTRQFGNHGRRSVDLGTTKIKKYNYTTNKQRVRIRNQPINVCGQIVNDIFERTCDIITEHERVNERGRKYERILEQNEISLNYKRINTELNNRIQKVRQQLQNMNECGSKDKQQLTKLIMELRTLQSQMAKFRGFEEDIRRKEKEQQREEYERRKQNVKLQTQHIPRPPRRYEKRIIEQHEIIREVEECKSEFSNTLITMKELLQQMRTKVSDVVDYNRRRGELRGEFI
jgi:hypothetical protein